MKKLIGIGLAFGAAFLVGCDYETTNSEDRAIVAQTQSNISSVQPIPDLRYSIQRETLIESYEEMSKKQPFFMIATSNDGDIIATAIVKGCVPATFQLTNPSVYEYNGATLPQAEINALFTGDTPSTYCIGYGGEFFAIEHLVAFSNRPFSQAFTDSAPINFTPNIKVNADGTVTNTETGETYE